MNSAKRSDKRRGALAVETAVTLPLLLIMLMGIWEVGRMIQVQQMLVNSAREGARLAAGGYTTNSAPVSDAMVKKAVRDYLQAAGLPAAAYNGASISLACQATPPWTNPSDALPLDKFRVTVSLPAGPAFESLRWSFLPKLTNQNSLTAVVDWVSMINTEISIDTALPF